MLVTFTSKAHGDITMFGNVAEQLIKMMGHSGTIPSAIQAEDVPAVLERLKQAIASHREILPDDPQRENNDSNEEEKIQVSLANRAFPLIEMLTAAVEENCNVMWYKN